MSNFPISTFFPAARDLPTVRSTAPRRPLADLIAPIEDPDDGLIDRYDPDNHEPPPGDQQSDDTADHPHPAAEHPELPPASHPATDYSDLHPAGDNAPLSPAVDFHGPRRAPTHQHSLFPLTATDPAPPTHLDISA